MKKLFITAIAVFTMGVINAQEVKFGAKAGLNLADVTNVTDSKTKVGFNVGALVDIAINEKLHFQPEVLYSTQGTKISTSGVDFNFNLDYINIPVMAKYYVADKFNIQAGPQLGFLIAATASNNGNSINVKENFKSFDFGLNFGLGYDIGTNILLDVRYNLGLAGLSKQAVPAGEKDGSNRVLSLSFGYKF